MPRAGRRLLTVAEAAGVLGITEDAMRKRLYRREIRFVKHGRWVRVDARDLERWIDAHTIEAAS